MNRQNATQLQPEDFAQALKELGTYVDVSIDELMQLQQAAQRHASMRDTESLRVEQLMTQPVQTVHADCSLADAAHIMVTRKIAGLPVVDKGRRLIGIITEADFLRALGVPSHHPAHNIWQTLENMFSRPIAVRYQPGEVSDLMAKDVISISPRDTIHRAIDVMKQHRIKRLVVCDDMRQVLGIVTRSDLVRVFFDRFTSDTQQHNEG